MSTNSPTPKLMNSKNKTSSRRSSAGRCDRAPFFFARGDNPRQRRRHPRAPAASPPTEPATRRQSPAAEPFRRRRRHAAFTEKSAAPRRHKNGRGAGGRGIGRHSPPARRTPQGGAKRLVRVSRGFSGVSPALPHFLRGGWSGRAGGKPWGGPAHLGKFLLGRGVFSQRAGEQVIPKRVRKGEATDGKPAAPDEASHGRRSVGGKQCELLPPRSLYYTRSKRKCQVIFLFAAGVFIGGAPKNTGNGRVVWGWFKQMCF